MAALQHVWIEIMKNQIKIIDATKRRTPKIRNKGCSGIHGAREMARRKRQIARGQLKPENSLDEFFFGNPHEFVRLNKRQFIEVGASKPRTAP